MPRLPNGRLGCCVPFCRHTTAAWPEADEWICGDHWRLIDKANRQAYGRHAKRWRRFRSQDSGRAARRLWGWLKRHAIERAAGITG